VADSVATILLARSSSRGNRGAAIRDLLVAARWTNSEQGRRLVRRQVGRLDVLNQGDVIRSERIGWERYDGEGFDGRSRTLTNALVLKAPAGNSEFGVLYVPFEYNWMRLLRNYDVRRLLSEYVMVGATSWSPTDFSHMVSFAGIPRHPLFVGISHESDIAAYNLFAPLVRPLPLLASDWVNPVFYQDRGTARDIDIIMVANFSRFKRHWLLFNALRRMPRNLRVVLVGIEAPGRTAQDLRDEAAAFGVTQSLEIVANAKMDEVTRLQQTARVSVVFSRREGSCVAVAESMMADVPVGLFHDAHIGSKRYINQQTGTLFSYDRVDRQLLAFIERSDTFKPRAWALGNITAQQSSKRMNDTLKEYALSAGLPWTSDIAGLCWRPRAMYLREADATRLEPARETLRESYGLELPVPVGGRWAAES
jgi:glycosyltransferase involved in cell wall biosynthesis